MSRSRDTSRPPRDYGEREGRSRSRGVSSAVPPMEMDEKALSLLPPTQLTRPKPAPVPVEAMEDPSTSGLTVEELMAQSFPEVVPKWQGSKGYSFALAATETRKDQAQPSLGKNPSGLTDMPKILPVAEALIKRDISGGTVTSKVPKPAKEHPKPPKGTATMPRIGPKKKGLTTIGTSLGGDFQTDLKEYTAMRVRTFFD